MVFEGDCVAIFHSIHRVMKAEKILQNRGLDFLLIPVPRQLSADCGMAIRFSRTIQTAVENALSDGELAMSELWLMEGGTYRRLR